MRHGLARALAGLALLATACGGVDTAGVTSGAVVPLDRAPLADAAGKRVVGIGEATHGNKEFVQARTLIIQRLVREHGFRTVALEADFGGTAVADDYVVKGQGTAEQAATALGFDIYRTRETANLLRWIHDHNATAADADKVRLYGFDMQRYDRNKERLLRYLATVEPAQAAPAEQALAGLTDATRSGQDEATIEAGATAAERIAARMRDHQDAYVKRSSPESFALALHHAETIGGTPGWPRPSSGSPGAAVRGSSWPVTTGTSTRAGPRSPSSRWGGAWPGRTGTTTSPSAPSSAPAPSSAVTTPPASARGSP
jgi:erythromycin esterase